ncbi:MAG: hypothetical protein GXP48_10050 [Acidobacteria bacterium]|nr:hypothetical protein [Acidobacteriota bacterium]
MRRLTLAQRVSLAAGAAVVVVLAGHTLLTGRAISAQVAGWEREQVAAFAHHVADMVNTNPPPDIAQSIAGIASDLRAFGIDVTYSTTGTTADGRSVSVPLEGNRGFIVARAIQDLSGTLRARLWHSSVVLALGVLAVLLIAVEGAVFWGAVLPLRRVQNQLDRMSRGPWHIDAEVGGGKEVAELSQHIEAVGASLEKSITQWIEAERRAAYEQARMELRNKSIPVLRELNVAASGLGSQRTLPAEGTRAVRRMLGAADRLVALLGEPVEPETIEPGGSS